MAKAPKIEKVKEKEIEKEEEVSEVEEVEEEETKVTKPTKSKGKVFTYVGGGEDSPRVITYMGKQQFIRGQAAEVTDKDILSKIVGNPTFIEGEVDQEELHEYDATAKKEADEQRKKDMALNRAWQKKHNQE